MSRVRLPEAEVNPKELGGGLSIEGGQGSNIVIAPHIKKR